MTEEFKPIRIGERRQKAIYVFKTIISVVRLAGFYLNDNVTIEDRDGIRYRSAELLKKDRNV